MAKSYPKIRWIWKLISLRLILNFPNVSRRPQIMKLYRNVLEKTNSPKVLNENYLLQKKKQKTKTEFTHHLWVQTNRVELWGREHEKITIWPNNSYRFLENIRSAVLLSNRTWRPGNRNLRQNFPRFSRQLFSEQLQPVASEHYLQHKITLLHILFGELCHCNWRASHKIGKWHKSEAASRNSLELEKFIYFNNLYTILANDTIP